MPAVPRAQAHRGGARVPRRVRAGGRAPVRCAHCTAHGNTHAHARARSRTHARTLARTHARTHARVPQDGCPCARTPARSITRSPARTPPPAHPCARIHLYLHVYMYICIYTHGYIDIYTYMHAYPRLHTRLHKLQARGHALMALMVHSVPEAIAAWDTYRAAGRPLPRGIGRALRCPLCDGYGKIAKKPCSHCGGARVVPVRRRA